MTSQESQSLKRELEGESEEHARSRKQQRRRKKNTPLDLAYQSISKAAKNNDRQKAMEAFRSARDGGLNLPQSLMNTLLFVLVGGENWIETAQAVCKPGAEVTPEATELEKCRDEAMQYMEGRQQTEDWMVYMAQARLSACLGQPDEAFSIAKKMLESKHTARLRMFTPALVGFAERGEKDKAMEIEKLMDELELELTELEFRLFLKAYTKAPGAYPQVSNILKRMGKELTFLQRETVDVVRLYFQSTNSLAAFTSEESLAGRQVWTVQDTQVDAQGHCTAAGENLAAIDLQEDDWSAFTHAFEALAMRREHKGHHLPSFMRWLEHHGPFSLVVDGANVAFHKRQGTFCFGQLQAMMQHLEKAYPDRKALLVLHVNRTKDGLAQEPLAKAFLSDLAAKRQFFTTPIGSNDDWYWLYAAIKAKHAGLLISNDECRDHIFQLLAPKYFLKWKERHLVRYEQMNGGMTLQLPSVYTSCTQQLKNGTWMLPYIDEHDQEMWLCARPL